MTLDNLIGCSGGCKRSSAAAVVAQFLNAADVVAVVAVNDGDKVAAAVHAEVAREGRYKSSLRHGMDPTEQSGEPGGRALVWSGFDAVLARPENLAALAELISPDRQPRYERLILVGGAGLRANVEALIQSLDPQLRFRYLVVE